MATHADKQRCFAAAQHDNSDSTSSREIITVFAYITMTIRNLKRGTYVTRNNHKPTYLEALKERVLIFDGAMGTTIDTFHLTAEDYGGERTHGNRDYLVITRPDVIERIHSSFMDAGCDVLETDTFQATRLRLEEGGLGEGSAEINRDAAQ